MSLPEPACIGDLDRAEIFTVKAELKIIMSHAYSPGIIEIGFANSVTWRVAQINEPRNSFHILNEIEVLVKSVNLYFHCVLKKDYDKVDNLLKKGSLSLSMAHSSNWWFHTFSPT